MLRESEPVMLSAGLEVKPSKCAVFHDRRSGNNWYKGRKNDSSEVFIRSHSLPLCKRDINYKYFGKSLSLCGEDEKQFDEFISNYQTLVGQIKLSVLPISLKCSAFNNLPLAKMLHHFYNTRLSEIRIDLMEKHLVTSVRDLLKLYKYTTQLAIFLPRDHGGLGVKKLSFVYYTTRIAFLVKMLNHDVRRFSFIARESLKFDMKKRNVTFVGPQERVVDSLFWFAW